MKFSIKEIFLIVIFLTFVVVVFYWTDEIIPEEEIDEGVLVQQEKSCIDRYKKMTGDEFFESLKDKNLNFPNLKDIEEIDERMDEVDRARVKYLLCKLKYDDESFYDEAKEFIIVDTKTSKETKDFVLNTIKKYQEDPDARRGFLTELALGDMEEICPDKITNRCLNEESTSSNVVTYEEWCLNICDDIEEYPKSIERFNEEIVDFDEWSKDPIHIVSQYAWRSAITFRLGEKELALRVCDNLDMFNKNNCQKRVEKLEGLKAESVSECKIYSDSLKEMICR